MLEYDNSAFYYFALTLLVFYIIPGTWYALSEFLLAFLGSGEVGAKARTKAEKDKAARLKKETTGFTRLNTTKYITNLILLVIAWAITLYLVSLVISDGEVSRFDPYQILGIEQGSETSIIKKAYRKLSLRYHPDKNIGDKAAEEMFMKIAKAYEALTDELSKENYEKYGNPDGKQALEVSIGLPKIILDNPKVVLVLYLIGMIVVIPSAVGLWYANSKQYGEKNIKYETYAAFYQLIQEQHRLKNLPEVLAASAECRALNTTKPTDAEPMGLLYARMKTEKLMVKPKFEHPTVLRGNLLLHAHLLRLTHTLNPVLIDDMNKMLARMPELLEGMTEISYQRKWMETAVAVIKLSQCMVQALWTTSNSLEQLPHLTEAGIKAITSKTGSKGSAQAKTLGEYLAVPDAEKKGLGDLSSEDKEEVLRVCKIIPHLLVDTKLFVEEEETDSVYGDDEGQDKTDGEKEENDEEEEDAAAAATGQTTVVKKKGGKPVHVVPQVPGHEIYEQDLVTLRVTLTRQNLAAGETAPPVHAPFFPKTQRESWWIILTDKAPAGAAAGRPNARVDVNIHAFEKVKDQKREIKHELRFMAPPRAGTYQMELQVLSDCYLGLDQTHTIEFTVKPASELPEYQPHPEDLELDNEPTLFEQVMAANADDESSDEEEEDEEEEEDQGEEAKALPQKKGAAGTAAAAGTARPGGKGVVVVADASDDSEEED